MKKVLILPLVIAVLATGVFLFNRQRTAPITENVDSSSAPTHIHAAFLLFTNETKRNFSASMYHERDSRAHLHASNPEIVHVHAPGVTWQGFFDSLPMKLTQDCLTTGTGQEFCSDSAVSLKFYLNERKAQDALSRKIKDGDKLLVSFGGKNEEVEGQLAQVADLKQLPLNPQE